MPETLDLGTICLRLLLATLAGGILGWEREVKRKPAGLRTHMMVSLGSGLLMTAALRLAYSMHSADGAPYVDPTRVMQGIVGGIGFLGAGAIIQCRNSVRGLTTAASIWLSAAVGVVCGLGYFALAGVAVAAGVIILLAVALEPEEGAPHEGCKPASSKEGPTSPSDDTATADVSS